MLELYHGTTAVCAIKVRLTLAEKELDWEGHILNLQKGDQQDPAYLKLNPNGVVPTLVHNGNVIIESSVIMTYLDEYFPEPALQPIDPLSRARMRLWIKRVDDGLQSGCTVITFATANRKAMLEKSPAELEAYYRNIPNPTMRELKRQSIELGLDAPQVVNDVRLYDKTLGMMEQTLSESPWLAGEDFSLADIALTPYLNRLAMIGLAAMWEDSRPRVAEWLERIRKRPSFESAVTSFITAKDVERFTVPVDEVWAKVKEILGGS